jgi:predicted transcriptional regulator
MTLELCSKNRCQHDIIEGVLTGLVDAPQKPTHVMYANRLSYEQTKAYAERLSAKGLIKVLSDGKWQITEKGRQFIASYLEFKEACA